MRGTGRMWVLIGLISVQPLCCLSAPGSDDWGYDDAPPSPRGERAGPAKALSVIPGPLPAATPVKGKTAAGKASPAAPVSAKPGDAAKKAPADPAAKSEQALRYWLDLYTFVSETKLSEAIKRQISENLSEKLKSGRAGEVLGILVFWPRVQGAIDASAEQKDNYRSLLRALLRLQSRKEPGSRDCEIVADLLGPVRVSVAGTPPLTETSIDAYADMACFLYEQKNPGKTVDALDNRAVFASVIREKFKDAPTDRDRQAMANFDLTWARFKVLWSAADDRGKQILLASWSKAGTTGGAKAKDQTLELVLNRGPWSSAH